MIVSIEVHHVKEHFRNFRGSFGIPDLVCPRLGSWLVPSPQGQNTARPLSEIRCLGPFYSFHCTWLSRSARRTAAFVSWISASALWLRRYCRLWRASRFGFAHGPGHVGPVSRDDTAFGQIKVKDSCASHLKASVAQCSTHW